MLLTFQVNITSKSVWVHELLKQLAAVQPALLHYLKHTMTVTVSENTAIMPMNKVHIGRHLLIE